MKEKYLVLPMFQIPVAGLTSKRRRVKRSRSAAIVATNLLVCSAIVWTMFVITEINLLCLCYIKNILYLFYFYFFLLEFILKFTQKRWDEPEEKIQTYPENSQSWWDILHPFGNIAVELLQSGPQLFESTQWVLIISPLANYHFVC